MPICFIAAEKKEIFRQMTMNKSQRPAEMIFLKTENLWFLSDKFDPACLQSLLNVCKLKKTNKTVLALCKS